MLSLSLWGGVHEWRQIFAHIFPWRSPTKTTPLHPTKRCCRKSLANKMARPWHMLAPSLRDVSSCVCQGCTAGRGEVWGAWDQEGRSGTDLCLISCKHAAVGSLSNGHEVPLKSSVAVIAKSSRAGSWSWTGHVKSIPRISKEAASSPSARGKKVALELPVGFSVKEGQKPS